MIVTSKTSVRNRVFVQELEVIASLIHPVLLGNDFLRANRAIVDFGAEKLIVGKQYTRVGQHCQNSGWDRSYDMRCSPHALEIGLSHISHTQTYRCTG